MKNLKSISRLTLFALLFCSPSALSAPLSLSSDELDRLFHGYKSAFVLKEMAPANDVLRYNPPLCGEPLSPCSTFKIFNSLVGLDSGVLENENTMFKWDGKKRRIAAWNQDQTLKTAVERSVPWYFQRMAGKVGREKMAGYLKAMHYGNEDMSSGLRTFWLGEENSLRISADEQVKFIERLYRDELPVSKKASSTVKSLIRLKETERGTLFGKTGTDAQKNKLTLGWFVGFVECGARKYAFACNIRNYDEASGKKARELTEKILSRLNLI